MQIFCLFAIQWNDFYGKNAFAKIEWQKMSNFDWEGTQSVSNHSEISRKKRRFKDDICIIY